MQSLNPPLCPDKSSLQFGSSGKTRHIYFVSLQIPHTSPSLPWGAIISVREVKQCVETGGGPIQRGRADFIPAQGGSKLRSSPFMRGTL